MSPQEIQDRFIENLQSPLCMQVNAAVLCYQLLRYEDRAKINWTLVSLAIIEKWSESGLVNIKTMAWQLVEGEHLTLAHQDEIDDIIDALTRIKEYYSTEGLTRQGDELL